MYYCIMLQNLWFIMVYLKGASTTILRVFDGRCNGTCGLCLVVVSC